MLSPLIISNSLSRLEWESTRLGSADYSSDTEYSSPLFQPKYNPSPIEVRGIPLQMRDSSGSVVGLPAIIHTK